MELLYFFIVYLGKSYILSFVKGEDEYKPEATLNNNESKDNNNSLKKEPETKEIILPKPKVDSMIDNFFLKAEQMEGNKYSFFNNAGTAVPCNPAFELTEIDGDLFNVSDSSSSLGHCVSQDLAMGQGIAVTFKSKFGRVQELVNQKKQIGECAILKDGNRFIYYLITKPVYFDKPTYPSLLKSLKYMCTHAIENNVNEIALPKIGCGLDQLQWPQVKELIISSFKKSNIKITICGAAPLHPLSNNCGAVPLHPLSINNNNNNNNNNNVRGMQGAAPLLFYRETEVPYGIFCNFYASPMLIDNKSYTTVEHYFQSEKYDDLDYKELIRLASTPGKTKILAHQEIKQLSLEEQKNSYRWRHELNNFILKFQAKGITINSMKPNWLSIQEDVMYKGLYAKFTQHSQLKKILMETGNSILQENSPIDWYWGIGKDKSGKNRLGYLLMKLRDEFNGENSIKQNFFKKEGGGAAPLPSPLIEQSNQTETIVTIDEEFINNYEKGVEGLCPSHRPATILRLAPFNSHKSILQSSVGDASTVAWFIKYAQFNPIEEIFAFVHTLIIDETGGLDEALAARCVLTIKRLLNLRRIIAGGDRYQLHSIAGGNVLPDLSDSGFFSSNKLLENHRVNADARYLYDIVKLINNGDTSFLPYTKEKAATLPKCFILREKNLDFLERTSFISTEYYNEMADLILNDPVNVQIIASTHEWCNWINRKIKERAGWIHSLELEKLGPIKEQPSKVKKIKKTIDKEKDNSISAGNSFGFNFSFDDDDSDDSDNNIALEDNEMSIDTKSIPPNDCINKGERIIIEGDINIYTPDWLLNNPAYFYLKKRYKLTHNSMAIVRKICSIKYKNVMEHENTQFPNIKGHNVVFIQLITLELEAKTNAIITEAGLQGTAVPAPHLYVKDEKEWVPLVWKDSYINRIKPSYAITTHGVQGRSANTTICIGEWLTSRELLSTAVGRARQRFIFYNANQRMNVYEAFRAAILNPEPERLTILSQELQSRKRKRAEAGTTVPCNPL